MTSRFRRGFFSTFSLDVFGRGLSAVATVLFIRALGVESFAYLVLFLTVGQFAGGALTGGIRTRYLRAEAERVSRGDEQATGFAMALAMALALIVATGGAATLAVDLLGLGDSEFVLLATLFTAAHASIELAMFHHQAHLRFARGGAIGVARSVALLLVAVLCTTGTVGSGPGVAAAAAVAVAVVAAVACAPLVAQTLELRAEAALGHFGAEATWLTIYYMASAGFAYANVFVVASLLDDEAIASFGAATRYFAIVLGPVPALLAVLRVRTSQHDVVDSTAIQRKMLIGWIRRTLPPVAAMVALAALLAPVVIPLIDDGAYPDSVPIFQLLMVSALAIYSTMPAASMLMAQKRHRLLAAIYLVALGIEIGAGIAAAELSGVVAVAATAAVVGSAEAIATAFAATRVEQESEEAADGPESAASAAAGRAGGP